MGRNYSEELNFMKEYENRFSAPRISAYNIFYVLAEIILWVKEDRVKSIISSEAEYDTVLEFKAYTTHIDHDQSDTDEDEVFDLNCSDETLAVVENFVTYSKIRNFLARVYKSLVEKNQLTL